MAQVSVQIAHDHIATAFHFLIWNRPSFFFDPCPVSGLTISCAPDVVHGETAQQGGDGKRVRTGEKLTSDLLGRSMSSASRADSAVVCPFGERFGIMTDATYHRIAALLVLHHHSRCIILLFSVSIKREADTDYSSQDYDSRTSTSVRGLVQASSDLLTTQGTLYGSSTIHVLILITPSLEWPAGETGVPIG